ERLRLALGLDAQLRERARLLLFACLVFGGLLRRLLGGRALARFLLAQLRFQLGPRELVRLALGLRAQLRDLACRFLFAHLLLGGGLRNLLGHQALARFFLAQLRFELDLGAFGGFLRALRLLHRALLGFGLGARFGFELRSGLGFRFRFRAGRFVR